MEVATRYIEPGSLRQNHYVKSVSHRLQYEYYTCEELANVKEAAGMLKHRREN